MASSLRTDLSTGLAVAFLWMPVVMGADAWPRFRGPQGDGVAAAQQAVPLEWDKSTNVRWRTEIPGQGWSSPVVADGKVFVSAAVPVEETEGDFDLSLVILDAASGTIEKTVSLMKQKADKSPSIHKKNSHASPTPILTADRVYVHFGYQGTACTDRAGKILWTQRDLSFPPTHGNGGSPVLVGDHLIFTCDGGKQPYVAALDVADGTVAWRVQRPINAKRKFSFCTPAVITVNGQQQVIAPGSDCVLALEPQTGEVIWQVTYDGYSVVPKPVFAAGKVFVATGFDRPSLLAIRPDGRGDVTDTHVAWTAKKGIPKTPSIIATGDTLLLVSDDGIAACFDMETGDNVWKQRLGGGFSSSPTLVGDRLYLTSEAGLTTVLRADRSYEKLAENDLGERTLSSMAVADNAIFLRTEDALYRLQE